MKLRFDFAQVSDGTGDAVNLGDHQHVAFAGEVERRLELRPFRVDARKLLREYLFDASRFQIAKLRIESGSRPDVQDI